LNRALEGIKSRNEQLEDLNRSIAEDSLKLLQLNNKLSESEFNLLQLTKELDHRVQERTRELLEAKTKAEDAMKLKSIILDNLGHELRTPLNGIIGFTQILKDTNVDESIQEFIDMISMSSNRLKNTLNSLLALTELEARRIQVSPQTINFKDFIERFTFSFEYVGMKKEVPIIVNIADENALAYIDEYMLEQICFNLLDNAVKFTDDGSITIEVNTLRESEYLYSVIRFIDTGIGIAKEKQSYVFEAFAQESEGIARNYEGVGVGLTITKKMIEMMNGSIHLYSEIGKGSTFEVRFPLAERELALTYE
jgi:signal transduction histidine kinase